jgi:hypothetical protein
MASSFAVSSTVQSGSTISAGSAIGTIKSAYRTFSLTGTKGTTFLLGDEVQLWGSNDGGTTYQPLVAPNGGGIFLTFGVPEVVINDSCTHYATQRTKAAPGSTLAAVGGNGEPAQNPLVQKGTVTLASGVATVTGVTLTTSSIIVPAVVTQGGTMTAFASLDVNSINVSAGSFALAAKSDANATLTSATPVVNYVIVG